jgi:hypothetical protein
VKIKFMGDFDGDGEKLPAGEHKPGAVKFKELELKEFGVVLNVAAVIVTIPLIIFVMIYSGDSESWEFWTGIGISLALMIPHELIHAACMPGQTYMYTWAKNMMLFVANCNTMSKARFIIMSMLPAVLFGFIPFAVFLFTKWYWLGLAGALGIVSGLGDYVNAFNCFVQVPKGHRVYNHKFNTYRYDPMAESVKESAEIGL